MTDLVDHLVEDPAQVERTLRPILKHLLHTCPECVSGLKTLGRTARANRSCAVCLISAFFTGAHRCC